MRTLSHAVPDIVPPRYHVLLVGIDAYEPHPGIEPLYGCVNDVEALESLLVNRVRVPARSVRTLIAPHPWDARSPRARADRPTSANLRDALEALAGDAVQPGDRVFIYYAGHGTQVFPARARIAREALVPVDVHAGGGLLYDYELNDLLRRVARRTADLTVVLDCCCSAGATRSDLRPRGGGVRFGHIDGSTLPPPPPYEAGSIPPRSGLWAALDPSDPGFLVAAACQSNERAHEGDARDGRRRGAFTAALLELLASATDEQLATLRWGDRWQSLRGRVASRFPGQHPWLIGRSERRILGGAWSRRDVGYPIERSGNVYQIGAGTMVGLGVGAQVAVYGASPDIFPPLGSQADLAARLGVLVVKTATPSSSTASAAGAVAWVDGARSRRIAPAKEDRLVVALDPYDRDLARYLAGEGPLRVVAAGVGDDDSPLPEAFVGRSPDGRRWIGDSIHGAAAEGGSAEAPLLWVAAADRVSLSLGLLHYAKYNVALRLISRCRDLPGALQVRLLDSRDVSGCDPVDLHDPPLSEALLDPEGRYRYQVEDGQPICVVVHNQSSTSLYTNLIRCSSSGTVELLGPAQLELAPSKRQAFWFGGLNGAPFQCSVPPGRASSVERLIAVGTNVPDVNLAFLELPTTFEEAVRRKTRSGLPAERGANELWTATLVTTRVMRAPSRST